MNKGGRDITDSLVAVSATVDDGQSSVSEAGQHV